MNTTIKPAPPIPSGSPELKSPEVPPPAGPALEGESPIKSNPARRRRRGKVALLPKAIREQINLMLEDGFPYRAIIVKLQEPGATPLPYPLTEHNLSEWKDGGYQDWLKLQFWQDELRARHDAFAGLLTGTDPVELPEGGLQFAAIGMCELLHDLSPGHHQADADPDKYIRAANSLTRLSRAILQLQHRRDLCARAAIKQLNNPKRKLTQSEIRAIVQQVDSIFGLDSEEEIDWTLFRGGGEETPKSAGHQPRTNSNKHQSESESVPPRAENPAIDHSSPPDSAMIF